MNNNENQLTPGLEDYLLAVNKILNAKKTVRLKDISQLIGVSNASANSAINQLVDKGFLQHTPYEYIEITPLGIAYANEIYKRRKVITEFFIKFINLNNIEIEKIVCRIEHYLSPFVKDLEKALEFFEKNDECSKRLKEYILSGKLDTDKGENLSYENEYKSKYSSDIEFQDKQIQLSNVKPGKYKILYYTGHRIELRLKQMGILQGDEIDVLSNQSGQVLIAKDVLRIGLGKGASHHIIVKKV